MCTAVTVAVKDCPLTYVFVLLCFPSGAQSAASVVLCVLMTKEGGKEEGGGGVADAQSHPILRASKLRVYELPFTFSHPIAPHWMGKGLQHGLHSSWLDRSHQSLMLTG